MDFGAGEIGRGGALRGGCDNPVASRPAPLNRALRGESKLRNPRRPRLPVPEEIQR
jgi:hypothetical protein